MYVRKPTMNPPGVGDATSDLVHSNAVRTASAVLLTYHGYKRTGSLLWALVYGIAGRQVPVVAVPVAFAQGIGKKKTCTTE
jgi:hypothetical protein